MTDLFTVFAASEQVAQGDRTKVAVTVKTLVDAHDLRTLLVFADATGEQVDFDMRGTIEDVTARYAATAAEPPAAQTKRKPGRPKLGVVGREVTLLPRHWEWLSDQPGGASVTLRKLVERARNGNLSTDRARRSRDAVYRFISSIAGNEPGYEDACRALFAGNRNAYDGHTRNWPKDVRDFAGRLAAQAFDEDGPGAE